jgi:hypothetical protein
LILHARFLKKARTVAPDKDIKDMETRVVRHLHVRFDLLLEQIGHTRRVIEALDTDMVERAAGLREWEREKESWGEKRIEEGLPPAGNQAARRSDRQIPLKTGS